MTMPSRLRIAALLLMGLFGRVLPAAAADWVRAESPHFRVLAQASQATTRDKVLNLERLHQAMLLTLGATEALARPPFPIVMSDDPELIGRVAPHLRDRGFSGLFTASADGSQAFVISYPWAAREDVTGKVLFHEYAHRVMAQYARIGYPVWYVEGFAEYFGATRITRDAVEIGSANQSAAVLGQRPWLDAAQILKPNFQSTGQKDVDDRFFGVFYAQSWLLTHYLLADSGRSQRFNDYFRRVAAGEDALTAFEPATGIPLARLNGELRRHLENLYAASVPVGSLKPVTVQISELPTEQAEAEFDTLVIASRPEAEHGKAVLRRQQERVKKAGGDSAPEALRLALAYAELRYGDADRALQLLAPWAQQDARPFEANRLLGWAWQSEAARSSGADRAEALDQARAFLMQAYKQRRNDAPTLYQLARVLYAKGPSVSLSNAADAASVLEPQNGEYAHLAASVHLEAGDRTKALRGLQALAGNPHGGESADRARAALLALQNNQDALEIHALLNGSKKQAKP